jgi:putative ABC transport system substrate-binding protein
VAAKKATTRLPIIFAALPDPEGSGIVERLARPGGNVTGVSLGWDADFVGKWLGLMKELLPKANRVALLWSSAESTIPILETTRGAARRLKMSVESFDLRQADDLEPAFRAMKSSEVDGVFVFSNPFALNHLARIVELSALNRLPAFYGNAEFVAAGGLIGYSANLGDQIRQAANFVDRVLKGAKPGDLPVEQPTKLELAINLVTAASLGLAVPQSLIVRADRLVR